MSIEVKIENRLKHTHGLREINLGNVTKLAGIRKKAMRGGEIPGEDQKWMVRTLLEALAFKENVYDLWIEDDTKTLEKGYVAGAPEPQVPVETAPDVAEAQEETPLEEIKVAAAEMEEEPVLETNPAPIPEPALEGMDRIHQLLN